MIIIWYPGYVHRHEWDSYGYMNPYENGGMTLPTLRKITDVTNDVTRTWHDFRLPVPHPRLLNSPSDSEKTRAPHVMGSTSGQPSQ